jgi:GAF domain-containing protein
MYPTRNDLLAQLRSKLEKLLNARLAGASLGICASLMLQLPAEAWNLAPEEEPPAIHLASAPETPPDAEAVRERVVNALHAAPYFYDGHVTVSVEKGRIVLQGFVFSDWDLRTALHIARQSAGAMRVVDNLTIKEGGRF